MITPDQIKSLFRYSHENGVLYWKRRPESSFKTLQAARAWNSRYSNKPAGHKDERGCIRVLFNKKYYKAHRIIWVIVHGKFPAQQIDHINGNPSDNRISNIRMSTQTENMRNRRLDALNKTGIPGVRWVEKDKAFCVYISNTYVKSFKCFLDACCARKSKENEFGYHPNHGRIRNSV